jgi:hypothetical protein
MTDTVHAFTDAPTQPTRLRTVGRWMITFAGFPLGGAAAIIAVGPVDTVGNAVAGGLLTGAILGAVQGWALRADRRLLLAWTFATAIGLAIGLTVGASLVDFGTDLRDLLLQGAVSGFAIGAAQAAILFRRTGPLTLFWPVWLAAVWAAGWAVSTSIGIQVGDQFTVFGSSGAVTATFLTVVLPLALDTVIKEQRS